MKVKELKQILEDSWDGAEIIITDDDRTRYPVKTVESVTVEFDHDMGIVEDTDLIVIGFSDGTRC
ncbi:hypothetical protein Q5O14_17825 [Eubacteriaceae bacterium ES2]|nr:hypothetical protein Q5O14_17825 [Eubacteriaceae bacterium ES2]